MDASVALAKHIVSTRYEDLPPAAVATARKSTLDTMGVAIAASGIEGKVRELVELAYEDGGREESTILGIGGKTSARMAAFANGALAHALDYDDICIAAILHPSLSTIPATIATAERLGRVNGKEFITAVALGQDLICRLGFAVTTTSKARAWTSWALSQLFGFFSAAAASGKILGLDEEQMTNAFGLAFCQCCGTVETFFAPQSHTRQIYGGFSSMGGVFSALMAQKGIAASKTSLEGPSGLYRVHFAGNYNPDALTADLGKRFTGTEIGHKAWPACSVIHPFIEGTLSIVREHNISSEDIDQIIITVADTGKPECEPRICCEPLEFRRKPPTSVDAKFSTPWAVAVAAAKRSIGIGDFTAEGIKDRASLLMAQKVFPRFDLELAKGKHYDPIGTGMTEIRTKGGKVYSKRVDKPRGMSPENPMSMDDIIEKFRDCASYSKKPLSRKQVDRVIELVSNLEEVEDVSQIIKLLG